MLDQEQATVFGKLPRQDHDTAIAEVRRGGTLQEAIWSDPILPLPNAVAHGQRRFAHDFDTPKLDGCPSIHSALPFRSPRRAHVGAESTCPATVIPRWLASDYDLL